MTAPDFLPCTHEARFLVEEPNEATGEITTYCLACRYTAQARRKPKPTPMVALLQAGYTVEIWIDATFKYRACARKDGHATIKSRNSALSECLRQLAQEVEGYEAAQQQK